MTDLRQAIKDLILRISYEVSDDCRCLLDRAVEEEDDFSSKMILETIVDNVKLAKEKKQALCQSPGFLNAYITFGEKFFLPYIEEVIKEAVVEATNKGYLRPSMVDPLTRVNSGNNIGERAPHIEYEFKKGIDYMEVVPSIKGCGIELYNRVKIFTIPEMGENYEGIKKFVLECVSDAGGTACLPSAIGIGIGGQLDVAAKLSRRAMSLRGWMERNEQEHIARLEEELLEEINSLNIGCGGTGGRITTLGVNIETASTHTTLCPVAVNFHCWVARRAGIRIYQDGRVEEMKFMHRDKKEESLCALTI
ncbi:MAG: fumarate hydratase [Bacillota bacterium]